MDFVSKKCLSVVVFFVAPVYIYIYIFENSIIFASQFQKNYFSGPYCNSFSQGDVCWLWLRTSSWLQPIVQDCQKFQLLMKALSSVFTTFWFLSWESHSKSLFYLFFGLQYTLDSVNAFYTALNCRLSMMKKYFYLSAQVLLATAQSHRIRFFEAHFL